MDISGRRAPPQNQKPASTKDDILKQLKQQQQQQQQRKQPKTVQSASKPGFESKRTKRPKEAKIEGTKVIIRLLPPDLSEETLWQRLNIVPFAQPSGSDQSTETTDNTINDNIISKYFVQGKYSTKPFKTPRYTRAYIQFKTGVMAEKFVQSYRSTIFEDERESMIPVFAKCLYSRMPDESFAEALRNKKVDVGDGEAKESDADDDAEAKKKSSLGDFASYRLFLKYFNGEIERPESFLHRSKEEANKEEKSRIKGDSEKKTDTKRKKSKENSKSKKDTASKNGDSETKSRPPRPKRNKKEKEVGRSDKKNSLEKAGKSQIDSNSVQGKKKGNENEKRIDKESTPDKIPGKRTKGSKRASNKPQPNASEKKEEGTKKMLKKDDGNDTKSDTKPKPKMLLKRPEPPSILN